MNDEEHHKHRKYKILCIFGIMIGVLGWVLPEQEDIAFEIVKNNTDLCRFNHTSLLCDGTRQSNVTYYTNNTSIVLYVFAHANLASQTAGVFLYRDNILIEAQAGRPLAAPEQTWRGITAIIPKNSSYRVNFTDYHHFEWYEDHILSGRNGTLSINQTISGCVGDCSFNNLTINSLGKNNTTNSYSTYINLISPLKSRSANGIDETTIDISNGDFFELKAANLTSGFTGSIFGNADRFQMIVGDGNSSEINLYPNRSEVIINSVRTYIYNQTHLDLGGANLTNCSNCGGNQNLSQVLNVGSDAQNHNITNLSGLNMTGLLVAKQILSYNLNIGTTIPLPIDDNAILTGVNEKGGSNFNLFSYLNGTFNASAMNGYKINGNISNPMPVLKDDFLFTVGIRGYDGTTITTTKGFFGFQATQNWTSTTQGNKFDIQTTRNGTTTRSSSLSIDGDKNITVPNLAIAGSGNYSIVIVDSTGKLIAVPMNGTGNHYICAQPNGYPFPGTPGC